MTLLLSNSDVLQSVRFADCIEAIARTYTASVEGEAAARPRATFWTPLGEGSRHALAVLDGIGRSEGVGVVRIRSDVYSATDTQDRKWAGSPGRFCGLILLFDLRTGAPLAILNDGILQIMRVAATAALATRFMARPDSTVLGILGAGGQARGHARAFAEVLPLTEIIIHSPTVASRTSASRELGEDLGLAVTPVAEPAGVLAQSDVVALCTNAREPVLKPEDLRPGVHYTSVRHWAEVHPGVTESADRTVLHQRAQSTEFRIGSPAEWRNSRIPEPGGVPTDAPVLADLLMGNVAGRSTSAEITYFLNNQGSALQFVACASLAFRQAKASGLGIDLPTDMFLQETSS